jgi:hypothetical protein
MLGQYSKRNTEPCSCSAQASIGKKHPQFFWLIPSSLATFRMTGFGNKALKTLSLLHVSHRLCCVKSIRILSYLVDSFFACNFPHDRLWQYSDRNTEQEVECVKAPEEGHQGEHPVGLLFFCNSVHLLSEKETLKGGLWC